MKEHIAKILQKVKLGGFAYHVALLSIGNIVSQGLIVISAPVVSRLYDPADFAPYVFFTSIVTITSVIGSARYEQAILLPEKKADAVNLLALSIIFPFLFALLAFLLLWIPGLVGLDLAVIPYGNTLSLLPLAILLNGVSTTALNNWLLREGNYAFITIGKIIYALILVAAQVGFSFTTFAPEFGLTGGYLAALLVSTIALMAIFIAHHRDSLAFIRSDLLKENLNRYKKFPLIDLWGSLANIISWQLPVLFFSFFFSPQVVAFYGVAYRLIKVPVALIGSAISQSLFQRVAASNESQTGSKFVLDTFSTLVSLSLLPVLILIMSGPEIFSFFLGSSWRESGVYVQILALWVFFWFISSPFSVFYAVRQKQERLLKIQMIIFLTRFFSLAIGGLLQNIYLALSLFSITGIFAYGYLLVDSLSLYQINLTALLKQFASMLPAVGVAALGMLITRIIFSSSPLIFLISSAFILLAYFIHVFWRKSIPILSFQNEQ